MSKGILAAGVCLPNAFYKNIWDKKWTHESIDRVEIAIYNNSIGLYNDAA